MTASSTSLSLDIATVDSVLPLESDIGYATEIHVVIVDLTLRQVNLHDRLVVENA
jgi:hypothetical protein